MTHNSPKTNIDPDSVIVAAEYFSAWVLGKNDKINPAKAAEAIEFVDEEVPY